MLGDSELIVDHCVYQNLLARNAALAEDVASSGRSEQSQGSEQRASTVMEKVQIDSIKRELQETSQRLETINRKSQDGSRTSELPSRERGEILVKEEVRKEAQKESEDELNDLLVCLGQEESKVEKLTAKLVELGVDVDKLLEDIGDDSQAQGECEDDDDDDQ
ncbi:hypothetical protein F2Q68_00011711 [Brassica cretica]|uniref:Uso1/p115-like vesicle tethering protein C-terminal domain-containing protein n=2 Tax=Brassica cretica TaxID=69181 RepID=A0A8S9L0L8_BRACR|nr:hypothetical protein F2Q68_00011711 [Brassica cretica]